MNATRVLEPMCKGLKRLTWGTRHIVGVPPQSAVEAFTRLSWFVENQPRYTPGRFCFPFGVLQYVDGLSLKSQYRDIFVQKIYDFQAEHEDPTILDCGGNVGLSAIRFKQRYPKSHITVFEADPMIAEVLCTNLMALGLTDVQVIKAAAWIKAGQVGFASDGADSGRIASHDGQQLVDAIRLADFITQPIDLLKLDIEGAEYAVIQDLCKTEKISHVRRLICEIHGRYADDREALDSLLKALVDHELSFTLAGARCAPDLPGSSEPTPFHFACDGKFLLNLYAWQPYLED